MQGNGQQPVATIQITLMPNGGVSCNFQGAGRPAFNLMMTTAMQDMVEKFKEQDRAAQVQLAPPGLKLH